MSISTSLKLAASALDELAPAIESLSMSANFLRRKREDASRYPTRTEEELVAQLLEAEARVARIAAKL